MIYLSPLAFQKIVTANSFSAWEVGFYGITDDDDVTRIHDVFMPEQKCNAGRNEFDEKAVSAYVAEYLNKGYTHRQLTSVWIHTHPGSGKPQPSQDDKDMFERMVSHGGGLAVMIIATKTHIKGWIKASVCKGLNRVVDYEEDVDVDWHMDTQRFTVENWKKRYKKVVSELHFNIGAVNIQGSDVKVKCSVCGVWKERGYPTQCTNLNCENYLTGICADCRRITGWVCFPCISGETTVDVPDEPARPEDCDEHCFSCDQRNECEFYLSLGNQVDGDGYDNSPSDYCNAECNQCDVKYCTERDDIPYYMCCSQDCNSCKVLMTCPYVMADCYEQAKQELDEIDEKDSEDESEKTGNRQQEKI